MMALTPKQVTVSQRALECPASPIRKLVPYADAAKRAGRKVYHLNIGQPDIPTPEVFWQAIKTYQDQVLAYGPSDGLAIFKKGLVGYYQRFGITLAPENLLVTTGGSEAIIFAFLTVLDQGDEVIIPEPFYTNYNGFAVMAGVTVKPITTYAENGFRLPPSQDFERLLSPRTKAIMLCNPGNPTGVVYNREEIRRIADFASKQGLFLITDEVYREFVFDGVTHVSSLEFEESAQNVIVVDSISKRYSACGARIGFIVSRNKQVMQAALRYGQARLCAPTLEQIGALASLDLPDSYMNDMIGEYQRRRDVVHAALMTMPGVICDKPHGAFYCIAKLPIKNAENFAIWLLNEYHRDGETVMVAPANGFYATQGLGIDEVRIAYVLNCTALSKAMELLGDALDQYRRQEA